MAFFLFVLFFLALHTTTIPATSSATSKPAHGFTTKTTSAYDPAPICLSELERNNTPLGLVYELEDEAFTFVTDFDIPLLPLAAIPRPTEPPSPQDVEEFFDDAEDEGDDVDHFEVQADEDAYEDDDAGDEVGDPNEELDDDEENVNDDIEDELNNNDLEHDLANEEEQEFEDADEEGEYAEGDDENEGVEDDVDDDEGFEDDLDEFEDEFGDGDDDFEAGGDDFDDDGAPASMGGELWSNAGMASVGEGYIAPNMTSEILE